MEYINCPIHLSTIIVVPQNEEFLFPVFTGDTVICFMDDGTPYLKYYFMDKCDIYCPTVTNLLETLRT